MRQLSHSWLKLAGSALLALLLTLGSLLPAFAQEEAEAERLGFSGTVTALSEDSITVEARDGQSYTAALTGDTKVRHPGKNDQSVIESELAVDAEVAVLARVEEDGSLTALWVLVKPQRPRIQHVVGTVISIDENNVLTIVDGQGNEHKVQLPPQAQPNVQVGEVTTVVVEDEGEEENGEGDNGDEEGPKPATAAVTARQIQERVAAHVQTLRERAERGETPVNDAEERIQFLSGLLDAINEHVQTVLTSVLEKVPDQAKDAIRQAMDRAAQGHQQAKQAIERGGGPPPNRGGGRPTTTPTPTVTPTPTESPTPTATPTPTPTNQGANQAAAQGGQGSQGGQGGAP